MIDYINTQVYYLFYSSRVDYLNPFFIFITSFGGVIISVLLTILVSIFLLKNKQNKYAYFLVANVFIGQILTFILKYLVNSPRPPILNALVIETDPSFPSGHSFITITLYFSLLIILNRDVFKFSRIWKYILRGIIIFFIIIIPFSRLYLGVHWMTDVVVSIFLGLLQTLILVCIFKIRLPKDDKMKLLIDKHFNKQLNK